MRFIVQDGGDIYRAYTIVDKWFQDPEKRPNIPIFIICECSDIDVAERIAKAMNEMYGEAEV